MFEELQKIKDYCIGKCCDDCKMCIDDCCIFDTTPNHWIINVIEEQVKAMHEELND